MGVTLPYTATRCASATTVTPTAAVPASAATGGTRPLMTISPRIPVRAAVADNEIAVRDELNPAA
jgi:hypothetical protein